MNFINLFVPGRVSIIGELSDFVIDYKSKNDSIIPGEVIAGGFDKGIYATASLSNDFKFEFNKKIFVAKGTDISILDKETKSNSFFSYVASVAYHMKKKYDVGGISIKVRYMSLPIQKGLSSSAAVCVLVVKAFNILYNLNLEYLEIMELAYIAERYALSMCGRLDQICAKGLCLSHIIFNEDHLDINELDVNEELNFVVADLNGFKDTKKILSSIHACFPFPKNEEEEKVRKALCENNKYLVRESVNAIKTGNKKYLGELLVNAQLNLDNSIGLFCDAIRGPLLHKVMNDEKIKEYSYGSKGTGSNGDGSIVILAKDKNNQKKIIEYLSSHYKMNSFEFNVKKTYNIKKAVINTLDYKYDIKELVSILQMLDNFEINNILIVGSDENINKYKSYLNKIYTDLEFDKLLNEEKEYQIRLYRIYDKIKFIVNNKLYKKALTEFSNKSDVLYVINNNFEEVKNILNNNSNFILQKNINKFGDLKENTIIKFK